ncbi:hypothetical protein [Acinetobacter sp. ANC 4640]
MKNYQDTQTGQIYAFEDDFDPFTSENRNLPKTLTETIKIQPTDTSVWYQEGWIEQTDAPPDYTPPISSVPAYNPAWMVHLKPYSSIIKDGQQPINFTLEQINDNSYDGEQLAKVIGTIPLGLDIGFDALISYDGAIAIPQCQEFPTRSCGIAKINEILCCLLIGGIHVEALHSHELVIGSLHEKTYLFAYTPSLHTQLRLNVSSIVDRSALIATPRILMLSRLQQAFSEGDNVIKSIPQFSPFFLLNGYTSLVNQNNIDALNNLWIVVEQLTQILWNNIYLKEKSSYPQRVLHYHSYLKKKNQIDKIFAQHNLLRLSKIMTRQCHKKLTYVRNARNDLVHKGIQPSRDVIINLWNVLPELFEIATNRKNLGIRTLHVGGEINWEIPKNTNFDEWVELSTSIT